MAKVHALLSLYFLVKFILVISSVLVSSDGLKLRMIHSHSLESPFSQNNISHEERIKMLASQSNIRTNYLSTMHANVEVQGFHYLVNVGIGTFGSKQPYKEYYLEMDTGSNLVWLQCEGCTKCFNQTPPPFPKDKSSSFRPILTHNNHIMTYNINYRDGDNSNGMLAHESFYIKTEERGIAKIENIQFGCGLDNNMVFWEYYKYNKIAGIMGLGWDDKSFVHQLDPKIKGRFSYCLPVVIPEKTPSTYLRFGDDISYSRNTKSTALYKRDEKYHYYVKMQGISINNVRLNISQRVFTFNNNDSTSDWIIDSGTIYSRIITPAFRILKLELKKYFSRFKDLKKFKPAENLGLELCYRTSKAEGFKNLPDITFHLQGSQADFILKAEAGFEVVTRPRKYFCLAMVRDNAMSFIGAHQQTNHRIIYDTKIKQLNFYPEDCSNNP